MIFKWLENRRLRKIPIEHFHSICEINTPFFVRLRNRIARALITEKEKI